MAVSKSGAAFFCALDVSNLFSFSEAIIWEEGLIAGDSKLLPNILHVRCGPDSDGEDEWNPPGKCSGSHTRLPASPKA
jgi:hypothetical protein